MHDAQQAEAQEPVEFTREVVIQRPAGEVYARLDWSDPRNAQRERGNDIEFVDCVPNRFRLRLAALPGHVFELNVTEAIPHTSYGFTITVQPPIGRMVTSREQYKLEPIDEASCHLTLVNRVTFAGGLTIEQLEEELLTMTVACHNALAKLKMQVELGVDAVRAVEGKLIV